MVFQLNFQAFITTNINVLYLILLKKPKKTNCKSVTSYLSLCVFMINFELLWYLMENASPKRRFCNHTQSTRERQPREKTWTTTDIMQVKLFIYDYLVNAQSSNIQWNLSKANPFGSEEFVQFRQMLHLHRFKLCRYFNERTFILVWFKQVFGLFIFWFRQVFQYCTEMGTKRGTVKPV